MSYQAKRFDAPSGEDARHSCDVCSRPLPSRCFNIIITDLDDRLVIGRPIEVGAGVVVRYHPNRCYPKNLVERLSLSRCSKGRDSVDALR